MHARDTHGDDMREHCKILSHAQHPQEPHYIIAKFAGVVHANDAVAYTRRMEAAISCES